MKNCRRTAFGWQLYAHVRGQFCSEHRTREPTAAEVRDWVGAQRAIAAGLVEAPEHTGTFAEDVEAYLAQVRTMASYRDRKDDLDRWMAVFGKRPRATITAGMIRAQLETWRAAGYAPSTVNHRRTALMHLWSVLDGKSAPNPARDVPRYREDHAPPRALSPAAARAILDAMPDTPTRARLELLYWTGWPPAQIARLEPGDVRWDEAVYVRGRHKGKGVAGTWLPLLPQGWAALKRFRQLDCWGSCPPNTLRQSFRRAAARAAQQARLPKAVRAELSDVTPYQLRHSFGTLMAGLTRDDRAVQTLMLHSDIRQTHRYTSATVDARAAAAVVLATLATKREKKRVSESRRDRTTRRVFPMKRKRAR